MATVKELRDKAAKLYVDARAILTGDDLSTEKRAQAEKMIADAEGIKDQAKMLDELDQLASVDSSRSIPRSQPGASETRSREERREATNKALRSYLKGETFEQRDLTVSADGILIPEGVLDPVVGKKYSGALYSLVRKVKTATGEVMKAPLVSMLSDAWVLASAGITTTDPTVGGSTIAVDPIRMNPIQIDNFLIQDSTFDLVTFIQEQCQLTYQLYVNNAMTVGNGSNVESILGYFSGISTTSPDTIALADLQATLAALDPAYYTNAAWLMSNQTLITNVQGIKDTAGRPIFLNFFDGATSGFIGTMFGFPVKVNPFHPNVGVTSPVVSKEVIDFGDFELGYTFREVAPGIIFKKSDQRYFEYNQLGVAAFARVGGAITDAGNGLVSGEPSAVVSLSTTT
jgi:HK97 family phage major capsid protein